IPSTCPLTRWPPRRSAKRNAFSRFTRAPAGNPAVVASVSGDTSASKPPAPRTTTVRHTPFTAMLSPIATSARSRPPALTARRNPPAAGVAVVTVPTAATIPENKRTPLRKSYEPGDHADVAAYQAHVAHAAEPLAGQVGQLGQVEHSARRIADHIR